MDLFLNAARKKTRFQTSKGALNTEQLFELNDSELNELYMSLESQIQESKGLLGKNKAGNAEVEEKMSIVKAVYKTLEAEKKASQKQANNRALRAKVLEALENKEVQELSEKSAKELRKMAAELA